MNLDDLISGLIDQPFSAEKAIELRDALSWYLEQNSCDDTLRVTADVARQIFLDPVRTEQWFRSSGARCDCEALLLLVEQFSE